jgi:hypothetical protein
VKSLYVLASVFVVACSASNPEIESFVKNLQVKGVELKLNDSLLLESPGLQSNERLILVNGQYRGRLCSESNMNEDLGSQVSEYSGMTAPAFALLTRNEKVVEGFPLKYSLTLPQGVPDDDWCAFVVDGTAKFLRLKCVEVEPVDAIGPRCSTISLEIERN